MIIQPIAENSIRHGIAMVEEKGFIKICFRAHTAKSIRVIIEDNGIGLKKSLEYSAKSPHHEHFGMQIIKKRLNLLSKKYNTVTGMRYSESSPNLAEPGAIVELILPFVYRMDDF
jgi:LytS/YehU family sensor histidine kinase